jgi:hypothetical protein
MTNRLLHDNWGDNATPYTEAELAAARARFRRRDTVAWLLAGLAAGALLATVWPWP